MGRGWLEEAFGARYCGRLVIVLFWIHMQYPRRSLEAHGFGGLDSRWYPPILLVLLTRPSVAYPSMY